MLSLLSQGTISPEYWDDSSWTAITGISTPDEGYEIDMKLVKYDAACRAITEAKNIDEVKDIRDKGKAIEAYAKQAKNKTLQADALEITLRAERRLGQLLSESPKATGGDAQRTRFNKNTESPPTLADMGIDKKLSSRSQKIAKIEDDDFEVVVKSAREKVTAPVNVHVSNNSGENEWYTPAEYLKSARAVMGSIDLDPASSITANKTVRARKFYSEKDNGLGKQWTGNVWLNPPYSQPLVLDFSNKLVSELQNIKQAIVLVNNATDTAWLQLMMEKAVAFCFVSKRIKFVDVNGIPGGAPLQGQVILYFGNKMKTFETEFSRYGVILQHAI